MRELIATLESNGLGELPQLRKQNRRSLFAKRTGIKIFLRRAVIKVLSLILFTSSSVTRTVDNFSKSKGTNLKVGFCARDPTSFPRLIFIFPLQPSSHLLFSTLLNPLSRPFYPPFCLLQNQIYISPASIRLPSRINAPFLTI